MTQNVHTGIRSHTPHTYIFEYTLKLLSSVPTVIKIYRNYNESWCEKKWEYLKETFILYFAGAINEIETGLTEGE